MADFPEKTGHAAPHIGKNPALCCGEIEGYTTR